MTSNWLDRLLKWEWLIIGAGVLLLFLISGLIMAVDYLRFQPRRIDIAATSPGNDDADATPRAVRYGQPEQIEGTSARLIMVYHGRGYTMKEPVTLGSSYVSDPVINVIFLRNNTNATLLFDRPVIIKAVDYPRSKSTAASQQRWIAYQVIGEDTDMNGRLSLDDRVDLYVSDLQGQGLRRVLDDKHTVYAVQPLDDGARMLIYALELTQQRKSSAENLRQVAFIYDPFTMRLDPFSVLNDLAEKAGRLVGKGR